MRLFRRIWTRETTRPANDMGGINKPPRPDGPPPPPPPPKKDGNWGLTPAPEDPPTTLEIAQAAWHETEKWKERERQRDEEQTEERHSRERTLAEADAIVKDSPLFAWFPDVKWWVVGVTGTPAHLAHGTTSAARFPFVAPEEWHVTGWVERMFEADSESVSAENENEPERVRQTIHRPPIATVHVTSEDCTVDVLLAARGTTALYHLEKRPVAAGGHEWAEEVEDMKSPSATEDGHKIVPNIGSEVWLLNESRRVHTLAELGEALDDA